ncbi:hypothetical protein R6Q57_006982 [Mikania cordata]
MASTSASTSSSESEGIDLFISALATMAEENASQIPRPIVRKIQINRDREAGHDLLMRHYFGNEPLYNETLFKRRFRMQRPLFERIIDMLLQYSRCQQNLTSKAGVDLQQRQELIFNKSMN